MSLLARVRRFVAQHHLAGRGTRVVVALSGGSDSVALAHIVRELDAAGDLRAAGMVHFNHQLRDTADRDQAFAVGLADSFGWRIVVEGEDVAARARRERRSIEAAARGARHECFERARAALGAEVIALGHTRDDQAETLLLRLLRGAGPTGLAGMHPRNGAVVRPLLCCRRHELRQFLAAQRIGYLDDETNADVRIPRNRVRAELLPLLERRFNPAIVDVLFGEAELAREMWLWLEESARSGPWTVNPRESPPVGDGNRPPPPGASEVELDVAGLASAPAALRRFVVWRAMQTAAEGRPVSFAHVQAVLDLLASGEAHTIDMPGHSVQRLGPRLVLRRRADGDPHRLPNAGANFFDYALSIPGEVPIPEAGCVLAAELYQTGAAGLERIESLKGGEGIGGNVVAGGNVAGGRNVVIVRRDAGAGQWRVRGRRPGDRFRPIGLGGRKKLQDFFVDRKVPRPRRDRVPLVVDERDRIVWVAGFGIDEAFRVTDPAQAVIMLQLKLLGGSA